MWLKSLLKKQAQLRKSLKGTRLHRIVGERVFHAYLWKHDKRSIAGGLSLGLFLAFTPTIPFQMLMAAFGAIYFRVNLPIALAACWVTNPITAFPIYISAYHVGRYTLEHVALIENVFDWYEYDSGLPRRISRVVKESAYLWTGSLVYGTIAAAVANVSVRMAWGLIGKSLQKLRASRASGDEDLHPDDDYYFGEDQEEEE